MYAYIVKDETGKIEVFSGQKTANVYVKLNSDKQLVVEKKLIIKACDFSPTTYILFTYRNGRQLVESFISQQGVVNKGNFQNGIEIEVGNIFVGLDKHKKDTYEWEIKGHFAFIDSYDDYIPDENRNTDKETNGIEWLANALKEGCLTICRGIYTEIISFEEWGMEMDEIRAKIREYLENEEWKEVLDS